MIFITKEERQALKRTLSMLEFSKLRFSLAVLTGTAGIASSIALGAVSAWLIAQASKMPPVLSLTVATVSVRAFGISKAVLRYCERLISHDVALNGINKLRENTYTALSQAPIDCVAHIRQGDLLARTSHDIDAIGDFIVKSLLPFYVALFSSVLAVTIVAFILPADAVALALCLMLSGIVGPLLTMRATRQAEKAMSEVQSDITSTAMNIMYSGHELVVNDQSDKLFSVLQQAEGELDRAKSVAARSNALSSAIDALAVLTAVISAIVLGVNAVRTGQISDVNLAVIVLLPLAAFEGVALLKSASTQLITSASSAVRICDLLSYTTPSECESIFAQENTSKTEDGACSESVDEYSENAYDLVGINMQTHNLTVGWNNKPALTGIDLKLTRNKKIAIVGPSGIGKSTLLFTLTGMLEKISGDFSFTDVEITNKNRQDLCNYVSLTTEDAHIFQTSIFENIRVADKNISRPKAYDLLSKAGLKDWIDSLPKGMDTVLTEGANSISGGQRRRILLARCFATNTAFVLIDEPSEHLDDKTADALMDDIFNLAQDSNYQSMQGHDFEHLPKGVIVVTHRLSNLSRADEVIMLEEKDGIGYVAMRGTHDYLMEHNSQYAWAVRQESEIL